jgi:hypothetical protein
MKKFILLALAALTLLDAPLARAWIYNEGDLLLIFRKGGIDVEFDLGTVNNYLGQTNGYTITVPGWSLSYLTNALAPINDPAHPTDVVLLASGGATNWLTSAEPNVAAYQGSSQASQKISGDINGVGYGPFAYSLPSNSVNAYVIDSGNIDYGSAAYDEVVTANGSNIKFVGQLGGDAPFTVQQSIPGFLDFWQVGTTTVYPGSPADKLIGTFTIDTNGVLTFVAGPRASTITSVNYSGGVSALKFTTTVGNIYNVAYTNKLGGATATWPVDGTTVTGNGRTGTINHTATGNAEFYRIQTQ